MVGGLLPESRRELSLPMSVLLLVFSLARELLQLFHREMWKTIYPMACHQCPNYSRKIDDVADGRSNLVLSRASRG